MQFDHESALQIDSGPVDVPDHQMRLRTGRNKAEVAEVTKSQQLVIWNFEALMGSDSCCELVATLA